MKRKTNLFYTSGEDSKFLTFSNYTEALTGNFLSTNIKVFPSQFYCLNIPTLKTDVDKTNFIKDYLVRRYENKLSVLRDDNTFSINERAILLDCINQCIGIALNTENSNLIVNISDITEQDFNGTFTDIICIIDSAKTKSAKFTVSRRTSEKVIDTTPETLHGWIDSTGEYTGPTTYSNVIPVYDEIANINGVIEHRYYNNDIVLIETDETPANIAFNAVLVFFNVVNTETGEILKENCPLGIWFADKQIELTHDGRYGQAWSLAIGSQFKPLPTTNNPVSDVTNTSNTLAFSTFAQVLSRQNTLLDTFNALKNQITKIQTQLNTMQAYFYGNKNIEIETSVITDLKEDILSTVNTDMQSISNRLESLEQSDILENVNSQIRNLSVRLTVLEQLADFNESI